jgi:chemotaxis signal transduction protein
MVSTVDDGERSERRVLSVAGERMSGDARNAEDVRRILHARAIDLAAPKAVDVTPGARDLIVFRIGAERYAVEAAEANEAIEIAAVTPLPGVPPFYRGLIGHQGIVYPLLDVRSLTGAAADEPLRPAHAILFLSPERTIALGADAVEGFLHGDAATVTGGVTRDGIRVLDVHVLLADARLTIDDRTSISDA